MRNEVPGSHFAVSENGWVDHELFKTSEVYCKAWCDHILPSATYRTYVSTIGLQSFQALEGAVGDKSLTNFIRKFQYWWYPICAVFWGAWLSAILPTNVIAGFRKSGTYPLNRDAVLYYVDILSNSNKPTTGMLLSIKWYTNICAF